MRTHLRLFNATDIVLSLAVTACSTYSATLVPVSDAGVGSGGQGGDSSTSTATGGTGGASSSLAGGGATSGGESVAGGAATIVATSSGGGIEGTAVTGGGSNASGGASTPGGTSTILVTGGAPTAGGAATGGKTSTGGAPTTGGEATSSAAIGGTPTTGGAPTGGTLANGGAAIGGAATAGASACSGSTCSGACVDVQSNKLNCGTCGHDCLGGECVQGHCQPAVVGKSAFYINEDTAPVVFLVDDAYIYYSVTGYSPTITWHRVGKTELNGTGTYEFSNSAGRYSWVAGQLYWNSYLGGDSIYTCAYDNCSASSSAWSTSGGAVIRNLSTQFVAGWSTNCLYGNFCINWLESDGSIASTYYDTYQPAAGNSVSSDSYLLSMASGAFVYWIATEKDSQSNFVKAMLFKVDRTSNARAQMAGGLSRDWMLLDVNSVSVVLADSYGVSSGSDAGLYRVPLPLGLGTQSPLSLDVQGVAGTEDESSFYWLDAQGTLYRCTASNCGSTTVVLSNGQSNAWRIMQDSKAIYWGRGNPPEIMRLAK